MSGYAMEWAAWIADQKQLDPAATLVLIRIAEHAHRKSGRANPGAETIAAETRFHVNTVREAMARLRKARVVDCETRVGRSAVWWFPAALAGKGFRVTPTADVGVGGDLSTPQHQRLGYPHSRNGTPPQSEPQTPTADVAEQERTRSKNKKALAAVAALPGDDADCPKPPPGPGAMFSLGSGWITDWTKGR